MSRKPKYNTPEERKEAIKIQAKKYTQFRTDSARIVRQLMALLDTQKDELVEKVKALIVIIGSEK